MNTEEVERFCAFGLLVPFVRELPAWRLVSEVSALITAQRVFSGNHRELVAALNISSNESAWDALVSNSPKWEDFRDNIDRLLHNYVSAASTLSETEQMVVKRRRKVAPAALDGYEGRRLYNLEGVSAFILALRNVVQHQRIPWVSAVSRGYRRDNGEYSRSTSWVIRRSVLDFTYGDDIGTRASKYLESLDGDPDLRSVIDEYSKESRSVVEWIFSNYDILPEWIEAYETMAATVPPSAAQIVSRESDTGDTVEETS